MTSKKLTRTQEMINFVWNNGPSTWTEIQRYMVGWDGTDQELCKSGARGYGAMSFWKTARSSARNRQYHMTKHGTHYVVIHSDTNKIHMKDKHRYNYKYKHTTNLQFTDNYQSKHSSDYIEAKGGIHKYN